MKRSYLITIALVTILLLSGLFFFKCIYSFLTPVKILPAEIFLLEGWAQDKNMESAIHEFTTHDYQQFLVTAFPYSELLIMGWEGKLTFHLPPSVRPNQPHNLIVNVKGTKVAGEYARFRVYVNDSLVGGGVSTRNIQSYEFQLSEKIPVAKADIEFINDAVYKAEDRNLIVQSLFIDNKSYDMNNCTLEYSRKNTTGEILVSPVFNSYALQAKYYLSQSGIPDSLIIPIEADTLIKSRTYSTALAVKNYLSRSGISFDAIMVMSYGVHARRSYISYKKAFRKGTRIGIIASRDYEIRNDNWFRSRAGRRKVFREVTGVLYAYFFL
jgi:hypothetical protein